MIGLKFKSSICVHNHIITANNGITDVGIAYLTEAKWPEVDFVHLSTNPFG